ncbi:L-histidine N(alpha)-methyltransferase [Aeoliella mucimassa]|uniref:Histidine-specific methyltransferase EgtD n=1 Tax=Aeoliella mucimassa TaxID=2527972 RepID=A0A518AUE3_9BACT|nr:L-histidine N(alpha)-methyltransferase [Aeoliella mucimassa]QDU58322.1 Histidine-specific methyltransferase EgtD [Aeoliella mucimassa]
MPPSTTTELPLAIEEFLEDVLEGLSGEQKTLPSKYFYDRRGSLLFDQICELPEYYPTRTEVAIMQQHGQQMADRIGERAIVVELGSGSSMKTGALLSRLPKPTCYVPVDISGEHLYEAAERIAEAHDDVQVVPVHADFTQEFALPDAEFEPARCVAYFPGSTIGNFRPAAAEELLSRLSNLVGPGGGLLIGFDLIKDRRTLEQAYDDQQQVTAKFNLNLLRRINEELDGDFDLRAFTHRAVFNEEHHRIEMHLVSQADQTVHLAGRSIAFRQGETVRTELSHKYSVESFSEMASRAGFAAPTVWTDPSRLFAVAYFPVEE